MTLVEPLALLIAVPLFYLWWRFARGPKANWPLRILLILFCGILLSTPVLRESGKGHDLVFLVDKSLSAGEEAENTAGEMIRLAQKNTDREDRVSVVTFGKKASVLMNKEGSLSALKAGAYEHASNLYDGLRLAGSICRDNASSKLVIVSDGLYTGQDPSEVTPELHKQNASVYYLPVIKELKQDVAIKRVRIPERVQAEQPYQMLLEVTAPNACQATLKLQRGQEIRRQQIDLKQGRNRFTLKDVAASPGLVRREIHVEVEGDSRPENNRAMIATRAAGPSPVLVITDGGAPGNFSRALEQAGLNVHVAGPDQPLSSAYLESFRAVVLQNVSLTQCNSRADAALRHYVRNLGGGLLVTGGLNSFANGGYYRSKLEKLLPVSMERQKEFRRPPLAMGIVLDRSGSMGVPVTGGFTKMDLANRAAAEAVSLLQDQDYATVFAVDSSAHEELPLTGIGDNLGAITSRIRSIEHGGGGIFVYNGLKAAAAELNKSDAPTRHIVLFADAADSEQPDEYKKLISEWRNAEGTITVVGLGTENDPDAPLLKDIAQRGNGRMFFTEDPQALPRVFCQDTMQVARKTFIKEQTPCVVTPNISRLGKLGIETFPAIGGYNLCYAKPDADQLVVSGDERGAPIVALWQRGLGKVAAATCQVEGTFSGNLDTWQQYKPFFGALVKWIRRDRRTPSLFGTIIRRGRNGRIRFEMTRQKAASCTGATARLIPPGEKETRNIPLNWSSPRTMEAEFTLNQNGIYHGIVKTNEGEAVPLPPVTLPYSPEFKPRSAREGIDKMQLIAENTGGERLMHVKSLFSETGRAPADQQTAGGFLTQLLAAAVLLLLLSDIVTRKALWQYLLPRKVTAVLGPVARRPTQAARATVRALRKARRRAGGAQMPSSDSGGSTPGPQSRPAPDEDKEAHLSERSEEDTSAEKEDNDSVFRKAKRRAR